MSSFAVFKSALRRYIMCPLLYPIYYPLPSIPPSFDCLVTSTFIKPNSLRSLCQWSSNCTGSFSFNISIKFPCHMNSLTYSILSTSSLLSVGSNCLLIVWYGHYPCWFHSWIFHKSPPKIRSVIKCSFVLRSISAPIADYKLHRYNWIQSYVISCPYYYSEAGE